MLTSEGRRSMMDPIVTRPSRIGELNVGERLEQLVKVTVGLVRWRAMLVAVG